MSGWDYDTHDSAKERVKEEMEFFFSNLLLIFLVWKPKNKDDVLHEFIEASVNREKNDSNQLESIYTAEFLEVKMFE